MTCPDLGSRHLLDLTPGTREPDAQRRRVPKSHPPHQDDPDGVSPSIGVGAPAQQDPEAMQGARMASSGRQVHRRHAILQHQAGVRPELQQLLHSPAADGDSGHQSFGRPGSRRQGRTSVPRSPRIFLAQCDQQFPGSVGHVPAVSQPSDSNLRGDFCARAAPPPRLPSPASGNALVGPAVPGAADGDRVGPGSSDRRKWSGRRCAKVGSHSGIWKAEPGITVNSRGAWDKEQNLSLSLTKQTTGYPRLSPSCPGTQRHPPASVCECWDLPPEEQRRAFSIQQIWLSLSLCEEGLHQGLEMAQRIKVLAAKLKDLSLIPTPGGRHWKENRLTFTCVPWLWACTSMHARTHKLIK